METDSLTPLRDALRQPDRRTWRRHLRRGATAVDTRTATPAPDAGALLRRPEEGADGPWRLPWWGAGAAVLSIAGGLVLLGGWLPMREQPAPPSEDTLAPLGPPGESSAPPPVRAPKPESETPGPVATTVASAAERLWPAASIEVVGREVRTAAGRWEIGEEGDAVVVGDWDCDRLPTPAVLRPSTGRIAVFDRWATDDTPAAARPISTIDGAVGLRSTSRCGEVAVRTNEGRERVVDTRPGDAP